MNPLGLAMAFVVFWLAIGLGLFLTFTGAIGMGKARRAYGIAATHTISEVIGGLGHGAVLAIGLALVIAGAYANYVVLYR